MAKPEILIVGGGMITHDQLLPALYHMQRQDRVGEISICGLRARDLQPLVSAAGLAEAFPGQSFRAFPDGGDPDQAHPDMFRELSDLIASREEMLRVFSPNVVG